MKTFRYFRGGPRATRCINPTYRYIENGEICEQAASVCANIAKKDGSFLNIVSIYFFIHICRLSDLRSHRRKNDFLSTAKGETSTAMATRRRNFMNMKLQLNECQRIFSWEVVRARERCQSRIITGRIYFASIAFPVSRSFENDESYSRAIVRSSRFRVPVATELRSSVL